MPVWSFVEEYDFSGKTVIPFYTHNGSSSGASSLETLKSLLPNSDFKQDKALSIRGSRVSSSKSEVVSWTTELGF